MSRMPMLSFSWIATGRWWQRPGRPPRGLSDADVSPGPYRVTLASRGYGSKRVTNDCRGRRPYQFRLLSDELIGYAWPKWVRLVKGPKPGIHSVEPFRLSLWRYGLKRELVAPLGWHDEHGPRAMMQITADGDYNDLIGLESGWDIQSAYQPGGEGAGEVRPLLLPCGRRVGQLLFVSLGRGRASPSARIAVLASTNTWNAYNNWGGRSNYVNAAGIAAGADGQWPSGFAALHRRTVLGMAAADEEFFRYPSIAPSRHFACEEEASRLDQGKITIRSCARRVAAPRLAGA